MKNKQLILGIAIGLVAGLGLGIFAETWMKGEEVYTIQVIGNYTALKINKRTGQTWVYDHRNAETWKATPQTN